MAGGSIGPTSINVPQHSSDPSGASTGDLYFNTTGGGSLQVKKTADWAEVGGAAGTLGNPATTMAQIVSDGFYYFVNSNGLYQAYVKKDWHESRDWMLILKTINRGDIPSGSSYWTNNSLNNETDSNITSGSWAKYASWNQFSFTRLMLDMGGSIAPIMIFNTAGTMYNRIQNNSGAAFGGLGCNSTNPTITTNLRYDSSSFVLSGSAFSTHTGNEPIVGLWGINSFANNASNSTTDNAGLSSVGRSGARVGCGLDEQGHTFNNANNGGGDSGFGFGYCGGNQARTGSCGYAEWNTSTVVEKSPGRLWVTA